ncbi:MAG: RNA methyltransferase [Gemmatimonadetes bacterium]|nr:RNA methyltransferase [Gemmatimonadota bacterium]
MRALNRRAIREREGRFIAEGVRVVEDLVASPLSIEWAATASSLEDGERGRALLALLEQRVGRVRRLSDEEFARHAATESPQGVLAVAAIPTWELSDLLRSQVEPAVVLVLDAVQDPGNFGTLVRSAEALGASGVIALPGTVDAWNAKAIRAAMGSSFRVPLIATGWGEAADWLRGSGFRLLAGAIGGEPLRGGLGRAALIVGNEGAGVSPRVLEEVDQTVGIPLRGRAESLNVAAAAAILLYELTR